MSHFDFRTNLKENSITQKLPRFNCFSCHYSNELMNHVWNKCSDTILDLCELLTISQKYLIKNVYTSKFKHSTCNIRIPLIMLHIKNSKGQYG